jgi:hypothetical protein
MTMRTAWSRRLLGALALATVMGSSASAQTPAEHEQLRSELARVRTELEALREEYNRRLDDLRAAVAALQAQPMPESAPQPTAPVPAGATGAGGPAGSLPVYGNVNALSKIFNPDIAVISNFVATGGRTNVDPAPSFDLREVETSLQAVVDPYARADVFLAIGPEGVDIEEGYVTFLTLPGSLTAKVGKLRSGFGKVNTLHTHVVPWADRPLMVGNLLGGEEGLSGASVSLSRLVPNPWLFLEVTGEVSRQQSEVFHAVRRRHLIYVGRARGYRDITESSNLDIGGSFAYGHSGIEPSSTTRLFGVDATFRYRPLRRATYHRLQARTEFVWSRRSELAEATPFGTYASAEYQLARRWSAGVRYDHAERALAPALADRGTSWLLTFSPSEFSQVRSQYRRTRYDGAGTANELLVQLLFSIGAHGAHPF